MQGLPNDLIMELMELTDSKLEITDSRQSRLRHSVRGVLARSKPVRTWGVGLRDIPAMRERPLSWSSGWTSRSSGATRRLWWELWQRATLSGTNFWILILCRPNYLADLIFIIYLQYVFNLHSDFKFSLIWSFISCAHLVIAIFQPWRQDADSVFCTFQFDVYLTFWASLKLLQ